MITQSASMLHFATLCILLNVHVTWQCRLQTATEGRFLKRREVEDQTLHPVIRLFMIPLI
jgi:hypothetical protein